MRVECLSQCSQLEFSALMAPTPLCQRRHTSHSNREAWRVLSTGPDVAHCHTDQGVPKHCTSGLHLHTYESCQWSPLTNLALWGQGPCRQAIFIWPVQCQGGGRTVSYLPLIDKMTFRMRGREGQGERTPSGAAATYTSPQITLLLCCCYWSLLILTSIHFETQGRRGRTVPAMHLKPSLVRTRMPGLCAFTSPCLTLLPNYEY